MSERGFLISATVVLFLLAACGGEAELESTPVVRKWSEVATLTGPPPTRAPTSTPGPSATFFPTQTPRPGETRPPKAETITMYFCGIDRCRDSGEYGQLIYQTGINVWNGPEPNRGGVAWQADHKERVTVKGQRRVDKGPGGLWYQLAGGGWTNDLWLTEKPCTAANLARYSFTNCWEGEY